MGFGFAVNTLTTKYLETKICQVTDVPCENVIEN